MCARKWYGDNPRYATGVAVSKLQFTVLVGDELHLAKAFAAGTVRICALHTVRVKPLPLAARLLCWCDLGRYEVNTSGLHRLCE